MKLCRLSYDYYFVGYNSLICRMPVFLSFDSIWIPNRYQIFYISKPVHVIFSTVKLLNEKKKCCQKLWHRLLLVSEKKLWRPEGVKSIRSPLFYLENDILIIQARILNAYLSISLGRKSVIGDELEAELVK